MSPIEWVDDDVYIWIEPDPIANCANCRYWYLEQAIDGFATCHQLVYGKKWRMGTLEQVPQGDAAIVKTYAKFSCKYWENR